MKFMRFACLTLLVAIIMDISLVYAANSTGLCVQLNKNEAMYTSYYAKSTASSQSYTNESTSTWLTNPCTDCYIGSKPYTKSGNVFTGITTVAGQTKNFPEDSMLYDEDYRLMIWREDTTLLKTSHDFVWTIDK